MRWYVYAGVVCVFLIGLLYTGMSPYLALLLNTSYVFLIVEYRLLSRLRHLQEQIQLGDILSEDEHDEIGELAQTVKGLLGQMQHDKRHLQLYNTLIEDSPIMVKRLATDGTIVYVDDTYCTYAEKTRDELVGSNDFDHCPGSEQKLLRLSYHQPSSSEIVSEGRERWILWVRRAIFDAYHRVSEYQIVGVDISESKIQEDKLVQVYMFQSMIAQSVHLVLGSRFDELYDTVETVLADVGYFLGVDRTYLVLANGSTMSNTNEWCLPGIEQQKDMLQNLPIEDFPWWWEQVEQQTPIVANTLDDLPGAAAPERAILEMQHIKSLLVLPVSFNHTIIGFLGVDAVVTPRSFTSEEVELLHVLANVIGCMFRGNVTKTSEGTFVQNYDRG